MKMYELIPNDGRKSFYHKAIVIIADDGTETLYSYGIPVISKSSKGKLTRLWDGWSATTGRHIRAFCGISKKEFVNM